MDQAYNAHQARRKSRSSTNLSHLTLAPLTTKLPINDPEMLFSDELSVQASYTTSYLQGKSAPTTPSLLARSPSRTHHGALTPHNGAASPNLPKSKSASHLLSRAKSGSTTPGGHRRGSKKDLREDLQPLSTAPRGRTDSDWLLRAGVLISSETRETKGQSWLVSRASSTSLGRSRDGPGDDEDTDPDMFERERIAREHALASKHASRRGSLGFALEDEEAFGGRGEAITLGDAGAPDDYFAGQTMGEDEYLPGPDFVNLNERLEALGVETDVVEDDEADVRRLVTHRDGRPRTWLGNIMGWNLFSVQEKDEDDEDRDEDATDGDAEDTLSDTSGAGEFEGMTAISEEKQRFEPPRNADSGWQDAAWLLSVASKVAWA